MSAFFAISTTEMLDLSKITPSDSTKYANRPNSTQEVGRNER